MNFLFLLRGSVVVVLIFVAARPVILRPDEKEASRWAILLDSSESMGVKDPVSRFEVAKRIVENTFKSGSHALFSFSEKLGALDLKTLREQKADGKKTNLAQALQDVFEREKWKGAIVISDGRQVGVGDPLSLGASLGRPLITVGIGDKTAFKDVAVRSVQAPPFFFKNIQGAFSATLSITGYKGRKIVARLKEGEKLISLQTIQPIQEDAETTVHFQWTPNSLGTKNLTIQAEVQGDEITARNNRKDFTVDVGRDRFRVLYICGEPGPEYGFLRHQFKSDPAVELVTFVILRNSQNVVSVPDSELALIPFPSQDVLINQLNTFDLIVFEEFVYTQYGLMPAVLQAVRKKVEDGGSFLLMGGPLVFGSGSSYALPGIQEMFPVVLGSSEVSEYLDPLPLKIKAPLHPILKLEPDPEKNMEIWNQLPSLDAITLLPPAKPESIVLASVNVGQKEHPVLTVGKSGKGRVGVLTARTTWRWSMQKGGKEYSSDTYQQFWKNMVVWLTHSDEYKSVRVLLDKKNIALGDSGRLRIWVYDEYFKPLADADVRLQITKPSGEIESLTPRIEANGVYSFELKGEVLGKYALDVWASRRGKKVGHETMSYQVIEGYSEQEDLRPDFDFLRELALVSNGRFLKADDFSAKLLDEFDEDLKKKNGRKVLIWNSPWLMVFLILLLSGEWILRKKRGLP